MSYLLQTGRCNTKKSSSSNASASQSVNLSRSGRVGGGSFRRISDGVGGQVQTVRPPQHKHRVTPSNHRQQQQAQHNVESVLSMEEVLADLRILQDQQNEAERRLQHARATKQKRLEQQAAVEAQLDRLKYENGQQRAELQQATALLSVGQRHIAEARVKAEKAGVDLREFDRKVQKCLDVKRSLHSYQRMHDSMLQVLRNMLSQLGRLVEEAKLQHKQAEADYNKVKELEYSLRKDIKKEAESQQHFAKMTVDVRAKSASAENALNVALKTEMDAKCKKESMGRKAEEHQEQSSITFQELDTGLEQLARRKEELALKIAGAKEATNNKEQQLYAIWHRAIAIQKDEGHKPSLPPSKTNVPPVIDTEAIRESVEAETVAAAEETAAKDELEPKVEALRLQLPDLEAEFTMAAKHVDGLVAANAEFQKAETARSLEIFKHKTELDVVKKQVAETERQVQEVRDARESEVTEIQKRLDDVTNLLRTRQHALAKIHEENSAIDAQIAELQSTLSEIQLTDAETLEAKTIELEETKNRVQALETKVNTAEDFACEKNYNGRIAKYKQEVKRIKKGYPLLANVECKYRPDLRTRDQEAIDLKDFLKECKARTEAARKSIADNKGRMLDTKVPYKPTKRQQRAAEQLKAGEHPEQDKHSEPAAADRRKQKKIVTVQPRDLLQEFSQEEHANENLDQSFDFVDPGCAIGETLGNSSFTDDDDEDDSTAQSSKLQLTQISQSQPSFTQVSQTQPDEDLTSTQQSKKAFKTVRWHDRAVGQQIPSTKLVKEARRKNASFGSSKSTASISSHSTVQTSNKAAKASDARQEALAKARSSTNDHHSSNKSSTRASLPTGMTKECETQSERKQSSGEDMTVLAQGRGSSDEKSDIGASSGRGRGITKIHSGTSIKGKTSSVSSKSRDPTTSSRRPATEKNRHCGNSPSFHGTSEKAQVESPPSKSLASSKSVLRLSTKVSEKKSNSRSSADNATAAKKSNRSATGEPGKAHKASRSDSCSKTSHPRNDDGTTKKLSGPNKKQKTDPLVKASRSHSCKDAPKSNSSHSESSKNKKGSEFPSKRSMIAKAGNKSEPTEVTKHTKHSSRTSHSTDPSRSPKPSYTTQSTGIPSQEAPRGRRRGPKAQPGTGRGKKPRVEKFVDDFNFSFE